MKVDVGFAKEAPILGIFGMNVYNKNRLIMVTSNPTLQQTSGYFPHFFYGSLFLLDLDVLLLR